MFNLLSILCYLVDDNNNNNNDDQNAKERAKNICEKVVSHSSFALVDNTNNTNNCNHHHLHHHHNQTSPTSLSSSKSIKSSSQTIRVKLKNENKQYHDLKHQQQQQQQQSHQQQLQQLQIQPQQLQEERFSSLKQAAKATASTNSNQINIQSSSLLIPIGGGSSLNELTSNRISSPPRTNATRVDDELANSHLSTKVTLILFLSHTHTHTHTHSMLLFLNSSTNKITL
jgi:hypothetical protein